MSFLTRVRPSLSLLRNGGSAVQPSLASASRIPLYYGATDSFAECGPSTSAFGSVIAPFAFGGAVQIRNSTKRGGGSTKNNRNSAGKRLGPKKYGGQLVKEGQILIRQRGTEWHAGPHVGMGRDHTLYALAPGYVRYYAAAEEEAPTVTSSSSSTSAVRRLAVAPLEHATVEPTTLAYKPHPSSPKPRRRYIGIVFDQDGKLPAPAHAPRERRFGKADVAQLKRDRLTAIELARRDEKFSAAPGGETAWTSMLQNLSIQADASKAQI